MDLDALTERAMALRARFDAAADAQGRPRWTREQLMQGFVGDVGDLMKLVMAHEGTRDIPDHQHKLGHELADCLWSILVLARLYEINLEPEFLRMIETVSQSLPAAEADSVPPPDSPR